MSKRTIIGLSAAVLLSMPLVSLAQGGDTSSSPGNYPDQSVGSQGPGYTPPNAGVVDAGNTGYIDWAPMWWNPLAESAQVPPAYYYDGPVVQPPYWDEPTPPQGTICTQDAMQCPDGTWVGRSGPNCQFVCGSNPAPVDPYAGYDEAPYPGMPGNGNTGYIDWAPMWWNPLAESAIGEPPGSYYRDGGGVPVPGSPDIGPVDPRAVEPQGSFFGSIGNFFQNIFGWWGF